MHHTARMGLGFDEVDALTGRSAVPRAPTGPPTSWVSIPWPTSSAPWTATLADDPWHAYFARVACRPDRQGRPGPEDQGRHLSSKEGKVINVLDLAARAPTAPAPRKSARSAGHPPNRNPAERFRPAARQRPSCSPVPVGDLPRRIPLPCRQLGAIADNARDVDFAMRWGFGWQQARSRPGRLPAGRPSPTPSRTTSRPVWR